MRSLPTLAKCGYPAHEAFKLPSWMFWAIVESAEKDRVRASLDLYRATGAGAGGFEQRSREEIINRWNKHMTTPIRGESTNNEEEANRQKELQEMDRDRRAAMWGGG